MRRTGTFLMALLLGGTANAAPSIETVEVDVWNQQARVSDATSACRESQLLPR